jgi:two-component system response regulator HydG
VAVNCAAVPESLLESELFGHTRGAFTDARASRRGLLLQATGGTLFLDEIGDMPLPLQPKLLRVLQDRRFRPVGSDEEIPFDARLLIATHRDLEEMVAEGLFRQDLYFRINVVRLDLPPLRARGNDVLLLAQHFLKAAARRYGKQVTGFLGPAAERLLGYSWPGNVRELENCVERAVALTRFEQITIEDLPEKIRTYERAHVPLLSEEPGEIPPLEEIERRYILRVLESLGGNKTAAAAVLGLDRKTLYRKLERYGGRSGQAGDP